MRTDPAPKLVILDRDGTLNVDREDFVKSPEEWEPLPGALEAVARLNQDGWHVVLATNQPGIGRGLIDMTSLNAIHAHMNTELARLGGRIDAVFFCPHAPEEGCDCRKPQPGLILQIGDRFGIDLARVPVVGDSLRDLQATRAAGAQPHLVLTGKAAALDASQVEQMRHQIPGLRVHHDLAAFVDALLQGSSTAERGHAGGSARDFASLD
jgi:D-glycero-D-manno-heptose 1,7-bisphosphate phosphatase